AGRGPRRPGRAGRAGAAAGQRRADRRAGGRRTGPAAGRHRGHRLMTGPKTPSDHGWPTLASVHALVVGIDRQLATALTEMARTREELIEHKADSHRVHEQQNREIRALSHWRWWRTGELGRASRRGAG